MATRTKRTPGDSPASNAEPAKKPESGERTSGERVAGKRTSGGRAVRTRPKSEVRLYAEKIRRTMAAGTRTWTWAFLEVLARSGNVTLACYAADTDRQNAYQLRERDAGFRELWEYALEVAADRLEEEAWRRACEGVERYVVSQGKIVLAPDGKPLVELHYSDMLLERLLRAHRPERFRDNHTITGGGGPVVKVYAGFDPDAL